MDEDTEFGRDLTALLQEASAIVHSEVEPAWVHLPPDWLDMLAMCEKLGLSRSAYAKAIASPNC